MKISTESVQRLMEIGLMAAGSGLVTQAETILDGVQAARPDSELPLIGRAVQSMCAGRNHEAIDRLQAALEKNPASDVAMSMLALALRQCGLNQASRDAAQQVVDAGGNGEASALAKSILETTA